MPIPTPRRRRGILTAIGATIVALLAGAAVVQQRTSASWAAMEQRAAAMQSDFDQRDHRREPLWGEGTGGSAFAEYARAIALAKPLLGQDNKELVATLRRTDAQVAAETTALRARWRPAIEALRDGTHCHDARPPQARGGDPQSGISNLLLARWLTNVAVFEARALRHEGNHRQAVEWTLDAMTFGNDHVRNGVLINQMIGIALVAIATFEAWPDAALQRLDREALDLFADGLARLDAQFPERLDLRPELLFMVDALRHSPSDAGCGMSTAAAWRFGFSMRWMAADAFAQYAAALQRWTETPSPRWPEQQAAINAEMLTLGNSTNPLLHLMAPNLAAAESNLRQVVARLRLLRAAVGVLRGEDTALRDPLGDGPLSITTEEGGTRIRSVGVPDGRPFERFVPHR